MATLYAATEQLCDEGERVFRSALDIRPEQPKAIPLFHARVTRNGVERLDA